MTLHLPNGREVRLGHKILGRGAEGLVHDLADTPDLCAKIYLEPAPDLHQRLVALTRTEPASWGGDHPEHLHVAWPRQPLMDESRRTIGFVMPVVEGESLTRLFDPHVRVAAVNEPSWRVIIGVAARTARLLSKLHRAGIVMGDVSPANILVSPTGHVTLIDCDTVQFTDPVTNELYHCAKLTPEYAPPMPGGTTTPVLTPEHDAFGLAILICQLLMEGDHPFEGVPAHDSDADVLTADNIRMQNNRIVFPERLKPVAGIFPASVLPPDVLSLAHKCFGEGHRDPDKRPLPALWETALEHAGFELMGCRNNSHHLYHSSLPDCVWCERIAQGFDDRYPQVPISHRVVIPHEPVWQPTAPVLVPYHQVPPQQVQPQQIQPRQNPYAWQPPDNQPPRLPTKPDNTMGVTIAVVVAVFLFLLLLGALL